MNSCVIACAGAAWKRSLACLMILQLSACAAETDEDPLSLTGSGEGSQAVGAEFQALAAATAAPEVDTKPADEPIDACSAPLLEPFFVVSDDNNVSLRQVMTLDDTRLYVGYPPHILEILKDGSGEPLSLYETTDGATLGPLFSLPDSVMALRTRPLSFFDSEHELIRIPKTGEPPTAVVKATTSAGVTVFGNDAIYIGSGSSCETQAGVARIDFAGNANIIGGGACVKGMAVDATHVYAMRGALLDEDRELVRIAIGDGSEQQLTPPLPFGTPSDDITVTAGQLFFEGPSSYSNWRSLWRMPKQGGSPVQVLQPRVIDALRASPTDDGAWLVDSRTTGGITEPTVRCVRRVGDDGSVTALAKIQLTDLLDGIVSLTEDATHVYLQTMRSDIYRVKKG